MKIVLPVCFIYIPRLVLFLLLIRAISLCPGRVSKFFWGDWVVVNCLLMIRKIIVCRQINRIYILPPHVKINESPLHFSLTVFLWSSIKKALDKIAIIKALRNDRRIGEENEYFLVGTYRIYSTVSRDPKLWTCRLGITRTKNKSKTPGYKPRPIHYYKTELLTTGKPNIFGKKSHWLS